MGTKRGMLEIDNKEFPSIKSQSPFITWFCMIKRKFRFAISLLPHVL